MDVREFQEKLKKMQELAKEQGGSLRAEQIREEFSGSDLNSSQLVNVLKYLTGQGILIEGIETETEGSDAQEEVRRVPLTQEEEAYLKEYLESLPGEEDFPESGRLFEELRSGSADALALPERFCAVRNGFWNRSVRESVRPARSRARENLRMTVWWPGWRSWKAL